jgi:hypothetical protein
MCLVRCIILQNLFREIGMPGNTNDHDLSASIHELFPELCGKTVDLEAHAASVIVRALNDGSSEMQDVVVRHYGLDRVKQVARKRADRLSNPAYRAWRKRLNLPERDPAVEFVQGFWLE